MRFNYLYFWVTAVLYQPSFISFAFSGIGDAATQKLQPKLSMPEFSNTGETCCIFSCNINVSCPTHNEDEASSPVCINSAVHIGGHHLLSHLNQNTHYSCTISDFIFIVCTNLQICCHFCVLQYVTVVLKSKQHCGCTPWHSTHTLPWHSSVSQCHRLYDICMSVILFMPIRKLWISLYRFLRNSQMLNCIIFWSLIEFHSTQTLNEVQTCTPLSKVWLSLRLSHGTRLLNKSLWKFS